MERNPKQLQGKLWSNNIMHGKVASQRKGYQKYIKYYQICKLSKYKWSQEWG